jgi:hypothetical protein
MYSKEIGVECVNKWTAVCNIEMDTIEEFISKTLYPSILQICVFSSDIIAYGYRHVCV